MALRASADNNGWRLEQITLQFDASGCFQHNRGRSNEHCYDLTITCVIDLVDDLYDWQQAHLFTMAERYIATCISPIIVEAEKAAGSTGA
jgi:hypothetical protein